ncbi:hypothetical protein PT974_09759 [Cladobotryum mycophilum]|uniref:MHD domain-containing protein n=1 Tax=Cladobotryum mycophilum TaxID=491253 RepID=A0ABR0SIE4_9HYPO
MEDMARAEYPAMLAHLQPGQAVHTVNDRVKRISRLNLEIADWLQERRRIEEQYVMGMRKLAQFKTPNSQSELGCVATSNLFDFQPSLLLKSLTLSYYAASFKGHGTKCSKPSNESQILTSNSPTESRKMSNTRSESSSNGPRGGTGKVGQAEQEGWQGEHPKVDAASSKLELATQQWESQSPFIFETLQALDESRVNMLRDLLTQYQTHESDQAQRVQDTAVETLAIMLEINTDREVHGFVQKVTQGKAQLPHRVATRRSSTLGTQTSASGPPSAPPTPNPASQPGLEDDASEHNSLPNEGKPESKLRRLGTMFGGRRRQSVHSGFGQLSPQKSSGTNFGRLGSSHGLSSSQASRTLSPRTSSTNLTEPNRLSILPENPVAKHQSEPEEATASQPSVSEGTNGTPAPGESLLDTPAPELSSSALNGNLSHIAPPAPPSHHSQDDAPLPKDADGFTVRAPMHDPISEAQREAAEEVDQMFKLSIQNQPIDEEDPEAAQAAFSSVANTLKMGPATRRSVTVRGRRDVRHTMYAPPPNFTTESQSDGTMTMMPGSPPKGLSFSRSPALGLTSEASVTGTSDSQSVRSAASIGSPIHIKHPELTTTGFNASIVEMVSAIFEGGVIKSASVIGEIAFANNLSETSDESKTHETIRINNFSALERIGPNRIFVQNASPDQPDQFSLDISHLNKTSTAFSYRVFSEESETPSLRQHAPIVINSQWKPQGDKLGLLLQYHLNPESKLTGPVILHDLYFVVTYEGKANGAQTKPSGTHHKDKHLVYWKLGDVTLTESVQKIVCRIIGAEGVEPLPGRVEARWEYIASGDEVVGSGISVSRLETKEKDAVESDPFADENPASSNPSLLEQVWVDVPTTRRLVGGKYEGK